MSYMTVDQSNRVSQAYRMLGLKPVTSQHNSAARAFAKYRRKVAAQDERLAQFKHSQEMGPQIETPFPFMELPPELRNRIYQYALAQPRRLHFEVLRTPALACTSRHVRKECLPVFLQVNCFQVYFSRNLDGTFGIVFANETLGWLKTLPFTTKLIKDIKVTFQGDLIGRGPKSSVFQIVVTGSRVSVNHVEPNCSFCTDGWYGEHYTLPHAIFDNPAIDFLEVVPFEMKECHDVLVRKLKEAYFERSPDWGRGGLSITDTINLAYAAGTIVKQPACLRMLHDAVEQVADLVDRISPIIDRYIQWKAQERQAQIDQEDGTAPTDPV